MVKSNLQKQKIRKEVINRQKLLLKKKRGIKLRIKIIKMNLKKKKKKRKRKKKRKKIIRMTSQNPNQCLKDQLHKIRQQIQINPLLRNLTLIQLNLI